MPANSMPANSMSSIGMADIPSPRSDAGRSATALHDRYGNIGISAVAAAARYHGEASDQNEAKSYPDERFEESGT